MTPAAALACKRLTKRFGRVAALRSVELSVHTGECVAIFGRNGAGKSTFLQVAGSLIRSYEGEINIFGEPLRRAGIATRRAVGFVLHETCLYQDLSARDNLRFFARLYGIDNADTRALEMLARVELDHRASSTVRELSRGMKQRLAIARAMIHAPRLLLLDEPFTGLDEISSQALAKMLQSFAHDGGTVIMSTHDVERAFPVATRAVILERGTISYDRATSETELAEFRHAYWNVLFTGSPPASGMTTGPAGPAPA
jgi:heme exporter protein A